MEVFLMFLGAIAILCAPFAIIRAINSVLKESGFDFQIKLTISSWFLALIIMAITI